MCNTGYNGRILVYDCLLMVFGENGGICAASNTPQGRVRICGRTHKHATIPTNTRPHQHTIATFLNGSSRFEWTECMGP